MSSRAASLRSEIELDVRGAAQTARVPLALREHPPRGAVPGLGTIIHLSDECAIFVFVIIPIAGGCALEKTPARGDLFEHMHDPDPAPEP